MLFFGSQDRTVIFRKTALGFSVRVGYLYGFTKCDAPPEPLAMTRTSSILTLVCLAALTPGAPARADETGAAMAEAAQRFLGALDEAQRARASFAFDSPERVNWHWIPRPRNGLPIKELAPDRRALAFGLLNTGLSTRGMIKATTIMSYEEILRVQENGSGPVRDPELYYVSVFGTPGDRGDWGWRIEGHHLSLNFTLKDGKVVSATPFMFGSNPAEVKSGGRKGLRNLVDFEEPITSLILSLDEPQLREAVVSEEVPDVTTTPNSARLEPTPPVGISSDKLNDSQRALLAHFVTAYQANFPESIRNNLSERLAGSPQAYRFAWYGPADPYKPHAFRLQSPGLYIDFNIKQDEANHIHTFYRNAAGDFGLISPK